MVKQIGKYSSLPLKETNHKLIHMVINSRMKVKEDDKLENGFEERKTTLKVG